MRRVAKCAAAALLLAAAAGRATGEEQPEVPCYKATAGPFAVEAVTNVLLRDGKRHKDLPVSAYFPQAKGATPLPAGERLPVIVFSHGAGGSGDTGLPLVTHWASHGFVVLCPTHADSIKLRRQRGEDISGGAAGIIRRAISQEKDWVNRPGDISFLLDSLDALEAKLPALKGRLDRERLGVGGHSFGAFTAQAAGGATLKLAGQDEPQSFADPRVRAILQLSGQGTDQMGLHERSWDAVRLPMMCVTGSLDRGAKGQPPEWRREPFALSPPGDKYFLSIEGAHHGSFTGKAAEGGGRLGLLRPTGGDQKAIFEWVKAATTAFWEACLRGEAPAKGFLASDALAAASRGKARLERR
jgi:predicted dienelactone hydrolase